MTELGQASFGESLTHERYWPKAFEDAFALVNQRETLFPSGSLGTAGVGRPRDRPEAAFARRSLTRKEARSTQSVLTSSVRGMHTTEDSR